MIYQNVKICWGWQMQRWLGNLARSESSMPAEDLVIVTAGKYG
jgi:hypothetical protein